MRKNIDTDKPLWLVEKEKADIKKQLKQEFPEIGKFVSFKGEIGVIIHFRMSETLNTPDIEEEKYIRSLGPLFVSWDSEEEDYEQYGFFDYEYLTDVKFKYINKDGSRKNPYERN